MQQPLLVDAGNLFRITTRDDFTRQLLGQEGTEPPSNGFLTRYTKKLFHARVPGFDDAVQVHRQHAHVQRFDDVFAEILEPGDLERFLLERAVKLGVIQGHRNVTGDRLNQFDIVA